MVNLSCLRNWAFRATNPIPPFVDGNPNPHVHWHVAPRYREPVIVASRVFVDEKFGEELTWRGVLLTLDETQQIISALRGALGVTESDNS